MTAAERLRAGPTEPCEPWKRHVLTPAEWAAMAAALPQSPELALLALWADTQRVHALFHDEASGDFIPASVPVEAGRYPALSPARPASAWFERMVGDLWGHHATGGADGRPWLDHGRWPQSAPMSLRPSGAGSGEPPALLTVDGHDIHQIPLGPVHGGITEPGHFRFHAQGETVARLEIRLGYAHKGVLALMRGKSPRVAARFAARLSGDSTVAHSIAFAHAAEAAAGTPPPPRAVHLRAVMAELERIANHLGDCGAVAGDASFAYLPARLGRLRETALASAAAAFGHRLMMDCVIPGGLAGDIAAPGAGAILAALAEIEAELPDLASIYEDRASLAGRMVGTGVVSAALARDFAAGGIVGRASGRGFDARVSPGYPPYAAPAGAIPVLHEGDVDARVRLRLREIGHSAALLRTLLDGLPGSAKSGAMSVMLPMVSGEAIGWAEGFRGDIWHWLRLDGGQIAGVFMRDPSWLQWPLLEAAMHGNVVADFPLCSRSFNCSHSGVDL